MQRAVNADWVTHCQFSTLKGWIHYRVLIRQHWQEGTLLPLSQAQIRRDRRDTLMAARCRLKDEELWTFLSGFKGTGISANGQVNHIWMSDLQSRFKNLKKLTGIGSRSGTLHQELLHVKWAHRLLTGKKNAKATVAYFVRGGAQWPTNKLKIHLVPCNL